MVDREAGLVWTTRVAVVAFLGLLLALLVIGVTSVFGLKVAGRQVTETFLFVVPLMLALMGGGLVLNMILNLNKIGEHIALRSATDAKPGAVLPRSWWVGAAVLVTLTLGLLFGGDHYTRVKKERYLLNDARTTVAAFDDNLQALGALPWGGELRSNSAGLLQLMGKQNRHFPNVSLLIQEPVLGKQQVLQLDQYRQSANAVPFEDDKVKHVLALSQVERAYLEAVFERGEQGHLYLSEDSNYQLFYPVKLGGGRQAVLYFAQRLRYGKGSS